MLNGKTAQRIYKTAWFEVSAGACPLCFLAIRKGFLLGKAESEYFSDFPRPAFLWASFYFPRLHLIGRVYEWSPRRLFPAMSCLRYILLSTSFSPGIQRQYGILFLNILLKRPHSFNESNIIHGSKICGEFAVGSVGSSVAAYSFHFLLSHLSY